jgi:hypothetical protein
MSRGRAQRRLLGMTSSPTPRQLAVRETDGIEVTLLWYAEADAVAIQVDDRRLGLRFEVPVAKDRAMHAFEHPFTYADDLVAAAAQDAGEISFDVR